MLPEECHLFSRYLVGKEPTEAVCARYAQALSALKLDFDSPLIVFVTAHPWALGPVDAACALLRPDEPLRRRLLALAAILETTPECAPQFMPRVTPPGAFAAGFIALGLIATLRLATGLLLWPYLSRLTSPRQTAAP